MRIYVESTGSPWDAEDWRDESTPSGHTSGTFTVVYDNTYHDDEAVADETDEAEPARGPPPQHSRRTGQPVCEDEAEAGPVHRGRRRGTAPANEMRGLREAPFPMRMNDGAAEDLARRPRTTGEEP